MIEQKKKTNFLKYEWVLLLFSLAIASVVMPMLLSAASNLLVVAGFSLGTFLAVWFYGCFNRILNNNF